MHHFLICFLQGGGAFYGPKIDIKIQDAIGRKWQCSTIQLDFNLPSRFDMNYVDADQSRQRPIMIHRAIFGSLERFFGVLIENYAGAFPLWLAPVQARLLPVNDTMRPYAEEVRRQGETLRCCDLSRNFPSPVCHYCMFSFFDLSVPGNGPYPVRCSMES